MVAKKDSVQVTKKGNLYEGQEGQVTLVSKEGTYPVEVKFPNGDRRHFSQNELEKK